MTIDVNTSVKTPLSEAKSKTKDHGPKLQHSEKPTPNSNPDYIVELSSRTGQETAGASDVTTSTRFESSGTLSANEALQLSEEIAQALKNTTHGIVHPSAQPVAALLDS